MSELRVSSLVAVVGLSASAMGGLGGCSSSGGVLIGETESATSTDDEAVAVAEPEAQAEPSNEPEAEPERVSRYDLFKPLDWPTPSPQRLVTGEPGPEIWNQRADYEIDVVLDDETDTLSVDLTLTYTNNSPHDLNQLWFNLDQNLFKPTSKGSRATPGGSRFVMANRFDGGYTFGDISVNGEDAGMVVFDTIGRIALDEPVDADGGVVEVEIEYTLPVPPSGRQGIFESELGKVYQLAHWFPNVCVYDDVEGWNTLPHLGPGEFYTDFGDYEVTFTVPRSHIVAATGELTNEEAVLPSEYIERLEEAAESEETVIIRSLEEAKAGAGRPEGDGMLTWRFIAQDVRTFAWSSSPAFVWDAAMADLEERPVFCQSYYPPEAMGTWGESERAEGSTQYLRHAINYYSEWLGEYPYPQVTNVNGEEYGMEYPMIVFCGARPSDTRPIEDVDRSLFGVTDHEVGHQWFPMLLSSNERRYAWQDEGLNTYTDTYSYPAYWGEQEYENQVAWMATRMAGRRNQPIMTEPDRIGSDGLGYLGYGKPGFALSLLRDFVLGDTVEESQARFDAAMREYVRRWSYQHPMPWDFFRTIEDVTGEDLAWFWRAWFYETALLDQSVEGVAFDEENDAATVTVSHLERMVMPAVWEATFADGSTQRGRIPAEAWATGEDADVVLFLEGRELESFELDPDGVLPDIRDGNDRWEG